MKSSLGTTNRRAPHLCITGDSDEWIAGCLAHDWGRSGNAKGCARYFQKIIAERNGLSMAADILELAFGLTKKIGESKK